MKYTVLSAFFLALASCGPTPNYPQYQQPQPQVVTVYQPDGSTFLMNYLLYQQLMSSGGQTNVYNYYNTHRNDDEFRPERQNQYREQDRVYQEQIKTQKSNGFGSKSTKTTKSNGFGSKPVETQRSSGFGQSTYKPTTTTSSPVTTQRSSGFGSSSKPVTTKTSSGFGSTKSTTTSSSKGFGKKQ